MPFKAKYTFDYETEPTPKERLRVGKECEKNLKLNVKKYKPIERQILYTNNILMNDPTRLEQLQTIFYAYAHISKSMSIIKNHRRP